MKLRDYIIRRLLLAIPVVIGVLAITFVLSYVVGNPITLYTTERTRPEAIPGIMAEHGLNQPLYIQFFYYLRDLISGNWGYSRTARMDVTESTSDDYFLDNFLSVLQVLVNLDINIFDKTVPGLDNTIWNL